MAQQLNTLYASEIETIGNEITGHPINPTVHELETQVPEEVVIYATFKWQGKIAVEFTEINDDAELNLSELNKANVANELVFLRFYYIRKNDLRKLGYIV